MIHDDVIKEIIVEQLRYAGYIGDLEYMLDCLDASIYGICEGDGYINMNSLEEVTEAIKRDIQLFKKVATYAEEWK